MTKKRNMDFYINPKNLIENEEGKYTLYPFGFIAVDIENEIKERIQSVFNFSDEALDDLLTFKEVILTLKPFYLVDKKRGTEENFKKVLSEFRDEFFQFKENNLTREDVLKKVGEYEDREVFIKAYELKDPLAIPKRFVELSLKKTEDTKTDVKWTINYSLPFTEFIFYYIMDPNKLGNFGMLDIEKKCISVIVK